MNHLKYSKIYIFLRLKGSIKGKMPLVHENHKMALSSIYSAFPPKTTTKDSIDEGTLTNNLAYADASLNSTVRTVSF